MDPQRVRLSALLDDSESRRRSERLDEAKRPDTPAGRLRRILEEEMQQGWHCSENVLRAVAANANTPPDILKGLMARYPDAVCANPALPLLLLESPDFLTGLSRPALRHLMRLPQAPPLLIGAIGEGIGVWGDLEELSDEAALHVGVSGELLPGEWPGALSAYWRGHAARASGDARQWYAELVEFGLAPVWASGAADVPPPAVDEDPPVEAPPDLRDLPALVDACSPDTPPRLLTQLSRQRNWYVRLAVAAHPRTPDEALSYLLDTSRGGAGLLHQRIARHPNASPTLISRLARSERASVRRLARRHPNAPRDVDRLCREAILREPEMLPWPPLCRFVAQMRGALPVDERVWREPAARADWRDCLAAALRARPDAAGQDGREARRLLERLSHDGNRLVRAAAKARLADPAIPFELA